MDKKEELHRFLNKMSCFAAGVSFLSLIASFVQQSFWFFITSFILFIFNLFFGFLNE